MKDVSSKRERDQAVVVDVIRRFGPVSRIDIHDLTRLRPGTISSLVRGLLRERRIIEVGPSDNPTGRKQVLLQMNQDHGYVAALEFDAEAVFAAIMNLGGKIRHSITEPANVGEGVSGLVGQLIRAVERAICEAGIDRQAVAGIGIADPGLIDSERRVSLVSSTIDFWKAVPIGEIFESHFGTPVLLESNTRARTYAERILGAGHMADDMLYVEYGSGIGMGIISDGKILRGKGECAGEFGHTHVVEGGPACKCGGFGCLEALAGAPAIAQRARTAVLEGGHSLVLEIANGAADRITGWDVIEAARRGDKMCSLILEGLERHIGLALANAVSLLNPSLVVLDKRLVAGQSGVLEQIARTVRRQALARSTQQLEFRCSELGPEAGVLGVALLLIEQYFVIPALKLPRFMREPAEKPAQRKPVTV